MQQALKNLKIPFCSDRCYLTFGNVFFFDLGASFGSELPELAEISVVQPDFRSMGQSSSGYIYVSDRCQRRNVLVTILQNVSTNVLNQSPSSTCHQHLCSRSKPLENLKVPLSRRFLAFRNVFLLYLLASFSSEFSEFSSIL